MRGADLIGLALFGVIVFPFAYLMLGIVLATLKRPLTPGERLAWAIAITLFVLAAGWGGTGDPYLH